MRALVVDDSRPVRSILAKILRAQLRFETCEVSNGQEALESLQRDGAFDVVTVNWEMPVMDGMEFVSRVRNDRRFRHLPLLMITGESNPERISIAMRAGVNEYLVKPCTQAAIANKLRCMGLLRDGDAPANPATVPSTTLSPSTQSLGKIRLLLIDDSSVVRRVVSKAMEESPDIEVVGAARDGIEGLELIASLKPDAVLLDVDMPRMDGLEMLREMRERQMQVPVLMFSSRTERGAKTATDALLLGAKDFVFKPGGANMSDLDAGRRAIADQIMPRLRSLTRRGMRPRPAAAAGVEPRPLARIDLVVIGASTGGPAALAKLVADRNFNNSLHAPVVIAQHMPELFTRHLANRLAHDSGLDIAEAASEESLRPGMIRIAPGGRHVEVHRKISGLFTVIQDSPPVNSCRPSADVLFRSAAAAAKQHLLAVVLTGMGHDGRDGCRSVRDLQGRVIVQDEASSVVWGMPGSVARAGLADWVIPIEELGARLATQLRVCRNGDA